MKNEKETNNLKHSSPITIATMIYLSYVALAIITKQYIKCFFGYEEIGIFVNEIIILIAYSLVAKLCFDVNYRELLDEIKITKNNFLDNLLVTIFITLIAAVFSALIYQIFFMAYPNKTETISYLMQNPVEDIAISSKYIIFYWLSIYFFVPAIEEIVFRYTLYRVFVKKNENIKNFIIFSSILFAIHHPLSISKIIATLFYASCLAIIYLITKSIVFTFISHFIWNSSSFISSIFMNYFSSSNMSFVVFDSGFIAIMMLFLCILLSVFYYYKKGHMPSFKVKQFTKCTK